MMGARNHRMCNLILALVLGNGSLAGAASASGPVDDHQGQVIETPLFYAGNLQAFDQTFGLTDGSPNHPDSYQFAVKKAACEIFGEDESLFYVSSSGYAIYRLSYCLNLRTGAIFTQLKDSSGKTTQDLLSAHDSSRVQLSYAKALKVLADGAAKFRAGNYQPMNGFQSPARPALQITVDYLASAQNLYQASAKSWLEVQIPAEVDPIATFSLYPTVLADQAQELLVVQYDRQKVYSSNRFPVSAGLSSSQLTVEAPSRVIDPKTFRIRVGLVPSGEELSRAFDQTEKSVLVRAENRLNYFFCSYKLVVGRDLTCTIATKTLDASDIRLDLFTQEGRWLTGMQLTVESGFQSTALALTLPADLQPGNYIVYAKLLPQGQAWSSYIDQKTETIKIEAAP